MKNVLVQLWFLLSVVMLIGYVMCLPVNKTNNTENLKKRGNFDYSKLATVINSSKSNVDENDAGTTIDVQMIPNETTETNDNLDERISEKSESDKSSSVSTDIQNEDNIQTSNETENSSEQPMIDIDSKLDTTTKILSESPSPSTSTSENPIRSEKSDKEFMDKTSDKETSDTPKKNTDTNEMNLKSSPKNDLQPPSLPADEGKSINNEKPIIMDKPFIHPFHNNYPFPYIPFHSFPFQFSDPFNNIPLIPTEHIATDNGGNVNFDYRFPNKFDQDFFKYITDMIAENNEDGSFNFVERFNDGSMENIEGYFDDVSDDNNFFIKGGYTIKTVPNGRESSVSYVINDKGCLTWTH